MELHCFAVAAPGVHGDEDIGFYCLEVEPCAQGEVAAYIGDDGEHGEVHMISIRLDCPQNDVEVAYRLLHVFLATFLLEVPAVVVASMEDAATIHIDHEAHAHVGRVEGMHFQEIINVVLVVVEEYERIIVER